MKTTRLIIIAAGVIIACSNKNGLSKNNNQENQQVILSSDTLINFENGSEGTVPVGYIQMGSGNTQTLNWKIASDQGNKVMMQAAKNSGDDYNMLVLDKCMYQNFSMTVKIKAISGEEDQGGGLMWRYVDNNNYYLARYNPLEKNFRFYKVVNGIRKQLTSSDGNIKQGEWFSMKIELTGNKISCFLNDIKLIDTSDDTYSKPGNIGFWTKADAVSYFDDLKITNIK